MTQPTRMEPTGGGGEPRSSLRGLVIAGIGVAAIAAGVVISRMQKAALGSAQRPFVAIDVARKDLPAMHLDPTTVYSVTIGSGDLTGGLSVRAQYFTEGLHAAFGQQTAAYVTLLMPEGDSATVRVDPPERFAETGATLRRGTVVGLAAGLDSALAGELDMTLVGDALEGTLRRGPTLYTVSAENDSQLVIRRVGPPTILVDPPPVFQRESAHERRHPDARRGEGPEPNATAGAAPPACAPVSVLTVGVVFADGAKWDTGSSSQQALAGDAIKKTGSALEASGLSERVALPANTTASVRNLPSTSERRSETLLAWLQPGDSHWPEVDNWRDSLKIDAVALVLDGYPTFKDKEKHDADVCGRANLGNDPDNQRNRAVFVIARPCVGYYSFPHELGHVLGNQHEHTSGDTARPRFSYSYGYLIGAGRDRVGDLMASDCYPSSCRRLLYSTPDRKVPVGAHTVPLGWDHLDPSKGADAARTIAQTLCVEAGYR